MSHNSNTLLHKSPFSKRNKIRRAIWNFVWFLCSITPIPLHGFRLAILRLFGAHIGRSCKVYPTAKIWAPWNLTLDNDAAIGPSVIIYSMDKIFIGKRVILSQGAHLCAGSHDYTKRHHPLFTKPIVVDDDCWICAEAFIGPGVHIEEGVVVGARAVVTSSRLLKFSVYTGNPAKFIKERTFSE